MSVKAQKTAEKSFPAVFIVLQNADALRVGRPPATQAYDKLDLRGVEPLSESLAIATSPIAVYLYAFAVPSGSADKRASTFSSFIIRPCGQSFPRVVSYVIDARVRMRRCALSDSCH